MADYMNRFVDSSTFAMRYFVFFIIILTNKAVAQNATVHALGYDNTAALQTAFNKPSNIYVVIKSKMRIAGRVTIPAGKIIKFEPGGMLTGEGFLKGGIIDAGYHHQIFDTAFNIEPQGVQNYFSAKWFGATGGGRDDYTAIQKSITTCILNNIRTLFIPAGRYSISKPLILQGKIDSANKSRTRAFCTLEILGESSFWDSNMGTEIYPSFNNTFAIGIQTGKGCKIRKLKVVGLFKPPFLNDLKKFYNSSFSEFTDRQCRDSRYSPYAAIVIDPFTNLINDPMPDDGGYPGLSAFYGQANNLQSLSGSTATELEELSINGFVVGICSSPNGVSKNAEITLINKVQFENCKLAISGGQAQEKMNRVTNIACWGGTHTIFATGLYGSEKEAGNWYISHANIAGGVVRFIYNDQKGYFPLYINAIYAESIGSWGTINSDIASGISNCVIDFADVEIAGERNLLTSWGKNVLYKNCNFRFYGKSTPILMEGNCTFENCFFSGKLQQSSAGRFSLKNVLADPFDKKSLVTIIIFLSVVTAMLLAVLIFVFIKRRRINR